MPKQNMSSSTFIRNTFTILGMFNIFLLEQFCIHSFNANNPMAKKDGLVLQFAKFATKKKNKVKWVEQKSQNFMCIEVHGYFYFDNCVNN
jgi:hypothetical protein